MPKLFTITQNCLCVLLLFVWSIKCLWGKNFVGKSFRHLTKIWSIFEEVVSDKVLKMVLLFRSIESSENYLIKSQPIAWYSSQSRIAWKIFCALSTKKLLVLTVLDNFENTKIICHEICVSYCTIPSTIWPLFSEFLIFCRLTK